MKVKLKMKLKMKMKKTGKICWQLIRRYISEEKPIHAAALVYASVLALIPLGVLIVTVVSLLKLPPELGVQIQKFILDHLITDSADKVDSLLETAWTQARNFSWLNFGILLFSGVTFLRSIDSSIQNIWQIEQRRPVILSLFMYCMTVLLGPVLLGGSILFSATLFSLNLMLQTVTLMPSFEFLPNIQNLLVQSFPLLLTFLSFLGLNKFLPYTRVNWQSAAGGACFATVALEFSKWGFGMYVLYSTTYKNLYGILAIIPIFLLWLYILWNIVLFSVMISHELQMLRNSSNHARTARS